MNQDVWRARSAAHEHRVDELVGDHLARRDAGEKHPVFDFLFTYYSYRPAHLRRWHPGPGIVLSGEPPHAGWRGYRRTGDGVELDPVFVERRWPTVTWVRDLLAATASRPAFTGCFGLHEWAMVYRTRPGEVRHEDWPLRLGHEGTDAVVESHQVRCSHVDAFRFFTEDARPRNALQPTRDQQATLEQPGCLHANMDLYKWAYKLAPLVSSELITDAFELARDIRELDMRASPYDLSDLGYEPVRIETREGKAEYVAAQREFAARASGLRNRLIDVIDQIGELAAPPVSTSGSPS
ncbi:3-methyladenine DNA glycosylase [Actinobacteria bacterium YIM 96077]|uniref:3-methyladenine DNA glycosylase n=1 Tax=Phytoactinopolyspora halophila TaxID=1981511 RepID=A0A329QJR3_9ACTN|nr:3-methyladenine DNA glycosylase [Phytoactinopolyspora halophila]AYY12546.1 3-methyladenine DNA glycosylase [Actinobacteria bacterium YIM 96077]RAW12550.1 3-methyladenine DNA glycosylase [Phytoactinopolyspora halophila]